MDDAAITSADEASLRAAICAAGRRLGGRDLIAAGEGNLSIRIGGGLILTTPTGRRKDELSPDDLPVVPLDHRSGISQRGPAPSSDIAIHRAIYRARPDVMAIGHAHLPASMALTLAGEIPDPQALPETAHFLPRLPFVPFGVMGSDELADRIAGAFAAGGDPLPGAVLLERHGAVAVGTAGPTAGLTAGPGPGIGHLESAIRQVVDRLELVDVLCRVWRDAVILRAARGRTEPLGPVG